jgi:hypothetical protein
MTRGHDHLWADLAAALEAASPKHGKDLGESARSAPFEGRRGLRAGRVGWAWWDVSWALVAVDGRRRACECW